MKLVNGLMKWLTLLVFTLAVGLLVIIFLSSNAELDLFWLRIIMLAATAFIGSLIGRILFHRMPAFFLFLIVILTQVLSLLIVDHFYEIEYRLSFLTFVFRSIDFSHLAFPMEFSFQTPSVSDAAQGIFLLIISLPTLFFLRRRKKTPKIQKESPAPRAARPKFSLRQTMDPILAKLNPVNWQFPGEIKKKTQQLFYKGKQAVKSKPVQISAAKSAPASRKSAPATVKTPSKKTAKTKVSMSGKRKRSQMNNDVKLTSEEEHVCPYCLEKVEKNDPLGIVVCPECGTWHHQDCWDLTGTCGVAHRNEL